MARMYGIYVCAHDFDHAKNFMATYGYGLMDFRYVAGPAIFERLRGMTLIDLGGDPDIVAAARSRDFTILETPQRKIRGRA